jgi:hypothetical protein
MPQYWNFRWSKGVRCVPYYHIVVHEGVGDECVHEQLIADRFRLQCRDTSTPASSEATRALPRMESWVSAWLEPFFWSTSALLLDFVDEDRGTACLARNGTDGRDALVTGQPKPNWEITRAVGMPSSDGYESFVPAVLGHKASLFMAAAGLQRSFNHPGFWCRQHEARQRLAGRSWLREHGCGRRWRSGVAASSDPDTESMGFNGPKNRP